MPSLQGTLSRVDPLPLTTVWRLSAIMEAKGKKDLWLQKRPETLTAPRQQALIQSVESSSRIEGVTVPANRLRPLLFERSRPRDRSEEELAGYRKALDWIFKAKRPIELTPRVVLYLHGLAQGGHSGDAGPWKTRDNEIVEMLPNGERRIRFKPVSAKSTPKAMQAICDQYSAIQNTDGAPIPLLVAVLVFGFLRIHPFRDDNGRVSRLLTTLPLERHGFALCRHISLERLIEEGKDEYYAVLERCSQGWHDGANELFPRLDYFPGVIRRGYEELARQVNASREMGKSELIRQAIARQPASFTLADIQAARPSASQQLVKKTLARMRAGGRVSLTGKGRGARWRVEGWAINTDIHHQPNDRKKV